MSRFKTVALMAIATLAVSWAVIFIRLADADPISTALYRMSFAVLFLLPIAGRGIAKSLRGLSRLDGYLIITSGIVLGIHFAAWITSLKFTTIANSVIIVTTQPFFVAIAEAIVWKTKISKGAVWGMSIAFVGMILITGIGFGVDADNLYGEFLAFIGAICAGAYLMIGRKVRQNMGNFHYILPVYFIASVTLLVFALTLNSPLTGFAPKTWLFFALLGLVPTVVGHSLYNFLLKDINAHLIGLTILGEPLGAIILAAMIFAEYPSLEAVIGGALILIGIALALFVKKSDNRSLETA